jgi:hypothetical protein
MSRKIFYPLFGICLLAFGFFYFSPLDNDSFSFGKTLQIDDPTKEQTLKLVCDKGKVQAIDILILGKIDGTADIYRSYVEKESKYYELKELKPGVIHLKMGGDWYGSECVIRYVPENVKSGWLKIKYRFKVI